MAEKNKFTLKEEIEKVDTGGISPKNKRLKEVRKYTTNDDVLSSIDKVAFNQEDVSTLIEKGTDLIYLLGENFTIPGDIGEIKYIGIKKTKVNISGNIIEKGIDFQNLEVDIDDFIGPIENTDSVIDVADNFFSRCNKNQKLAIKLLWISAENDFAKSQLILSKCHENGFGVEKSTTEQIKWLKRAAEKGYAPAENTLGDCYMSGVCVEKNTFEAVEWYRKAAEKGYSNAQNNLGNCYYNGNGVEKNYPEAVKWYRRSAEQNNREAQFNLGNCYYNGNGVEKNYPEALKWYGKSAEQEQPQAQDILGTCYLVGEGVISDADKALEWFLEIDKNGYAKKVVLQCEILADRGDVIAKCKLGFFYNHGIGVKEDLDKAEKYYHEVEHKIVAAVPLLQQVKEEINLREH